MTQTRRKLNMYDRAVFCIRVQGDLDESWCDYFGTRSLTVSVDESGSPETTLISEPLDQSVLSCIIAGLLGIVNHLNALGLRLISVECRRPKRSSISRA